MPTPLSLLVVATSALLIFMHALVLIAHLPSWPRSGRREGAGRAAKDAALWGVSGAIALGLASETFLFTRAHVAWPYAVIVVGLAFLAAPFALRLVPLAATEGRTGLVIFAAASALALIALLRLA